jgi:nuclear cap-binding protein subunit 1
VLMQGCKSFSHVLNVIERYDILIIIKMKYTNHDIIQNKFFLIRYLPILQSLNESPEDKLHTVKIVAEFWKRNTQVRDLFVNLLIN